MNRFWIASVLLALLTGLCLWEISTTESCSTEITSVLEEAHAASLEQDWETTQALCRQSKETWETAHRKLCLYVSHTRLESIDQNIALLESLAAEPSQEQLRAEIARCLSQIKSLKSIEYPTPENLL